METTIYCLGFRVIIRLGQIEHGVYFGGYIGAMKKWKLLDYRSMRPNYRHPTWELKHNFTPSKLPIPVPCTYP